MTAPVLQNFEKRAPQTFEKHIPLIGDIHQKSAIAYQMTRGMTSAVNAVQMAVAESYIAGVEVPDSALRALFNTCMPVFFKYFPSLLAPYEWVLKETDHLAEGSRDLMKIQYDLPQEMLNPMLGDGDVIYPKYSMGLWQKGAANLEEAQKHMIDDMIEKMDIQDGDNILDFGCGWGCVPNYILSKFPNVRFTGLNLSHWQCEYMRGKMQDPKSFLSSDRFTLHEGDLNDAKFEDKFDKILSVGVFCHVGNLTNSFRKLASFLTENGTVFIHIITVRTPNNISSPFTHKYIFPNGRYWNYDAVPSHNKDLKTVNRWYMNGINYHKTFAAWLENFDANQDLVKDLNYGTDYDRFRRIWRFYLIWLGTNFAVCDGECNGNGQYLMVRT
ncbi:SAM-dependent methyltransferase [Myxacorys almedinensis]|uniref:Methyltransferase domain-containing protein n=1 Tax=Myxacorys almedinensis A TaxID=2690445 RepID=A0A8J7Z0J6_9CYAN|nr:class I SAM-dependent methyltransferase [Myxacorys almedinensis]NDJ17484.1 methyltransferase domain-containing protein [Myxacorys almedinensis A]